ncbi:MAG: Wzz/FepE/Etk N-terminal domain-containing protein [Flavobacteriia bacterium]|nr:Wzz/FepE/Etk N-terminal domain-containing protein [Flavobacteriia bacterium]
MENKNNDLVKSQETLIRFLLGKKKQILIITFIISLGSIVVSLLITPLYLSTAIVFPAATSSVSFSEQRNAKSAAMDFGEEEQTEQLVQILQSSRIRDKIISQFKLMSHYGIDNNDINKYYKLKEDYNGHFSFERTRYGSIKIDVLDEDPELAAKMANKIVDLIDTVKNDMISERTIPAFEVNRRKKVQMERERDSILSCLDSLASLGVIALDVRSNLFQAYVDSKNPADREELKRKIEINMKYGAKYDGLEYMRNEKTVKLEDFRISYEQAESDANTKFNHKFIVERAVIADRKEKPKRMIIVFIATIAGFVLSVFSLLLFEKYKELSK